MTGKELNEQTVYNLLREFDSTILEKFGFGSCNLSLKAQVGFMIGFISLISSHCINKKNPTPVVIHEIS